MNFIEEINAKQEKVNEFLNKIMSINGTPEIITQAMKYSVFAGGKRIRPVLALSICSALGGNNYDVMPLACSIELIHTYSLIHDDLPAMDDDDLRRGKPTSHKVFGEANAILAGDALLNYAFETIFDTIEKNNFEPRFVETGGIIAKASGVYGMIGGQVIDIQSEGKDMNIQQLIEMHSMKTGALIEAACLIGCIIAERRDRMDDVKEYSRNLGIAFQIVDDILDCVGDTAKLGKNVGRDEACHKSTFVSILGLERARELAVEYSNNALEKAKILDSSGFLTGLTEYLLNRES